MKGNWKEKAVALGLPLAIGGLAALLVRQGFTEFGMLRKPPLSPPGWVFPVVWTVLYLMMGWASYRVWRADPPGRGQALAWYGGQLLANFLWPLLFFGAGWYLGAFLWLVVLWASVLVTWARFSRLDGPAGDLLLPYLLWVTFAGYLNFGVWRLNA